MTYALVPVDGLDEPAVSNTRTIFENGFPEHIRAPWSEVSSDRLDSEDALALVCDGEPVGFVLLRRMGTTSAIYLRYLVIDESRRGQGIGSAAWQHLRDYCTGLGLALLVWDVEHPDEPRIDAAEESVRRRRIVFYERLGGVAFPVDDYTNPHEDGSGTHEAPMVLMATGLDGSAVPTNDPAWLSKLVDDVNRYRWNR